MTEGRTSSYCSTSGCVEVGWRSAAVVVRNSRDLEVELLFSRQEWEAFVAGVKAGEFDLP